jgi:hypothetical protein
MTFRTSDTHATDSAVATGRVSLRPRPSGDRSRARPAVPAHGLCDQPRRLPGKVREHHLLGHRPEETFAYSTRVRGQHSCTVVSTDPTPKDASLVTPPQADKRSLRTRRVAPTTALLEVGRTCATTLHKQRCTAPAPPVDRRRSPALRTQRCTVEIHQDLLQVDVRSAHAEMNPSAGRTHGPSVRPLACPEINRRSRDRPSNLSLPPGPAPHSKRCPSW